MIIIASLMLVSGYVFNVINLKVKRMATQFKDTAARERNAAELHEALLAIQNTGQRMAAERYLEISRKAEEPTPTSPTTPPPATTSPTAETTPARLEAQIKVFGERVAQSGNLLTDELRRISAARGAENYDSDLQKHHEEANLLLEIEREFAAYKGLLGEYSNLLKNDLGGANRFADERLKPHYETRLFPLVRQFEGKIKEKADRQAVLIEDAAARQAYTVNSVMTAVFLIVLVGGFWFANSMTKPLRKLRRAVEEVRRGDFDLEVGAASSKGEVGVLTAAFNRMAREIAERTARLEEAKKQLEAELQGRRRTEEALRKSEEYRNLFRHANDPILIFDPETEVVLDVNERACQTYGYTREEFIGRSLKTVSEDVERGEEQIQQLLEKGTHQAFESVQYRADGTPINLLINSSVIEYEGRRAILSINRDITERKKAEDLLQRNLSLLTSIFESTADGILVEDANARVITCNQKFLKMWRITAEQLKAAGSAVLLVEASKQLKDPADFLNSMTKLRTNPETRRLDVLEFTDGRVYERYTQPQILAGGEIVGRVMSYRDVTEHRRAEEERERFFTLSKDLFCSAGLDGRFRRINPAWEKTLGYTREELFARPFVDLVHPDDRPAMRDALERAMQGNVKDPLEIRMQRKDGSHRWFLWTGAPVPSENLFYTVGKDITRYKQIQAELQESRQMLQLVLDTIPQSVFWKNHNLEFIGCNRVFAEASGFASPAEVIGKTDYDFPIAREDAEFYRRIDLEVIRTGNPKYHIIKRHRMTDGGRVVWVSANKVPLRDAAGEVIGVLSTFEDITEQRTAKGRLQKSEERFRRFMDNNPTIAFMKDDQGRYIYFNQTLEQTFQIKIEDVLGKTDFEWLPGEVAENLSAHDQAVLANNQTLEFLEVIPTPDGENREWMTIKFPIEDADGKRFIGGVSLDLTDRKRAETARHQLEEQLRQAQKLESIGTLAGGVAHDFNNLLTVILGNCQLSRRKLDDREKLGGYLHEIETAATRATEMTKQLLAFSRRQRLARKSLDPNLVIEGSAKMLRRFIDEDIELTVRPGFKVRTVFADPQQIEQILMNFVVNARDAMQHGGRIDIETRNVTLTEDYVETHPYAGQAGEYVQISVRDTGIGMDAETVERIFEPFFTTKEVGKGTGLGLAVVYGIVKQHNGFIEVDSQPGKGTTFKVYFPAEAESEAEETTETEVDLRGGSETILLVEDEARLRDLATEILTGYGYSVLAAQDGAEAVEVFEEKCEKIDLVLMDMVMPRKSGPEAYLQMRDIGECAGRQVPVVFMTGYSPEIVHNKFTNQRNIIEEAQATLIQKPYDVETLISKVREALDTASADNGGGESTSAPSDTSS